MSYDIVGSEVVCGEGGRFRRVKITETTWEEMNAEILRLREENQMIIASVVAWREAAGEKNKEISELEKENKKLREAVIKERFWALWKTGKWNSVNQATKDAESELREEGVIE